MIVFPSNQIEGKGYVAMSEFPRYLRGFKLGRDQFVNCTLVDLECGKLLPLSFAAARRGIDLILIAVRVPRLPSAFPDCCLTGQEGNLLDAMPGRYHSSR